MLEAKTLAHELQLGNSLNKSVQQTRRADFALMLALLTDDVREHSQFHLPETETTEIETTTETLRREFDLPNPQKLGAESTKNLEVFNQSFLANKQLQASIRLSDALNPLPLSFRDSAKHIPTQVLANTSIHCQERALNHAKQEQERTTINAKEWLKVIKSSLTLADISAEEREERQFQPA